MATLSNAAIEQLLQPYLQASTGLASVGAKPATQAIFGTLVPALGVYLDLLLRWNQRTNLTAIRRPEQMVQRHFGESLFAARVLANKISDGMSVLDIGSGAGFPGLPIQLALPHLKVTLAESHGKKIAFLREVIRETGAATEVWPARAQELPAGRRFDAVTMRAVDPPEQAIAEAHLRLMAGGCLLHLRGNDHAGQGTINIPGLNSGVVEIA